MQKWSHQNSSVRSQYKFVAETQEKKNLMEELNHDFKMIRLRRQTSE